jgi:hypothetical protein
MVLQVAAGIAQCFDAPKNFKVTNANLEISPPGVIDLRYSRLRRCWE